MILITAILLSLFLFVLWCCCLASSRSERVIETYKYHEALKRLKNEEEP